MIQTIPKLRLAEPSTTRPDLAEQIAAPLAAATSSAQPPLGRPGPATMSALTTARLSAWRELSSRWMVLVLLPMLLPIGLLFNDAINQAWQTFLAIMVAPMVCVLAAAGGRAESDTFWRGLGGPAWARQLGRQAVHLVMVGCAIAVLLFELSNGPVLWRTIYSSSDLFLSIALIYPARTRISGIALIAGPLAALVIVGTGMLTSIFWMRDWSLPLGMTMRLSGFTAAALVASYRWERTAGLWSSAVGRGRLLVPAACMGALLAASVGAEWAWSRGVIPPGHNLFLVNDDGSMALYRSNFDEYSPLEDSSSVRYWLYTEADGYRRLPGRYHEAYLGQSGSVLGLTHRAVEPLTAGLIGIPSVGQSAGVTATLMSGDQSLSCDLSHSTLSFGTSTQWRSDGRGVIFTNSTIDSQHIFDLDSGACGKTANQFYLGDELLEREPTGVRWKNQLVDFADHPPSLGQWDAQGNAALIRGPQDHLYRIAIRDQQLVMTGPFSGLEDSIIAQTAHHTAVWAGQDGMDYRSLQVVDSQDRLLRNTPGTVRVTTAESTADKAYSCVLPDDLNPYATNAARGIRITQGDQDKSLNRPRTSPPPEYYNSWSSLEISNAPNPCSGLDTKISINTQRGYVEVGQTTVRWQGQEVAFGDGPPTPGQWNEQGHTILIRGLQDHLYTITIDDQILSVSGPFSDFEASGKVRSYYRAQWLSERVFWNRDADPPMAVDVIDGTTWDLSAFFDENTNSDRFWSPLLRDGEPVHFGGELIPSTSPQH